MWKVGDGVMADEEVKVIANNAEFEDQCALLSSHITKEAVEEGANTEVDQRRAILGGPHDVSIQTMAHPWKMQLASHSLVIGITR